MIVSVSVKTALNGTRNERKAPPIQINTNAAVSPIAVGNAPYVASTTSVFVAAFAFESGVKSKVRPCCGKGREGKVR